MSSLATVVDFIGASGFVAGVGAIFGLGRLYHKVETQNKALEALTEDLKAASNSQTATAITLGRVEERIANNNFHLVEIKQALRGTVI